MDSPLCRWASSPARWPPSVRSCRKWRASSNPSSTTPPRCWCPVPWLRPPACPRTVAPPPLPFSPNMHLRTTRTVKIPHLSWYLNRPLLRRAWRRCCWKSLTRFSVRPSKPSPPRTLIRPEPPPSPLIVQLPRHSTAPPMSTQLRSIPTPAAPSLPCPHRATCPPSPPFWWIYRDLVASHKHSLGTISRPCPSLSPTSSSSPSPSPYPGRIHIPSPSLSSRPLSSPRAWPRTPRTPEKPAGGGVEGARRTAERHRWRPALGSGYWHWTERQSNQHAAQLLHD